MENYAVVIPSNAGADREYPNRLYAGSPRLATAQTRTVVLLGHGHHGVPEEAWDLLDDVVEIPMVGRGASLNVAVAGSLVLYRLAGLM